MPNFCLRFHSFTFVFKKVKLIRRGSYDTMYGTTYVYTFEDAQGHQLVWKTGTWLDQDSGDQVTLKGTIKAHSEYNGIKQTELTRCKVSA